jgi:hypothetical protein
LVTFIYKLIMKLGIMSEKFKMPALAAEKTEELSDIEDSISTVMNGMNKEYLKNTALLEDGNEEKNQLIAKIIKDAIDILEDGFGLERYSDDDLPEHEGLVKSEDELHRFMAKCPDYQIKEVISSKLKELIG